MREEAMRGFTPLTPEEIEAKQAETDQWAAEQIAKIQARYAKADNSEGSADASRS